MVFEGNLLKGYSLEFNEKQELTKIELPNLEERKKGEWIEHKQKVFNGYRDYIECSCCKVWFGKWEMPRNSFCPNCGADMRGSKND